MSDIPGCGIGALDHVYLKLKDDYPGQFDLMPFVCIVDPERLRMILPEKASINLPEEMRFLLDAQMAEADLIVLNKTDSISLDELLIAQDFIKGAYPDTPVMHMSAKTGAGTQEIVDYLMGHEAAAIHREIGYGTPEFMAAEKKLSWYNRRFFAAEKNDRNIDFNSVVKDFIEAIRDGLIEAKRNVPHLKLFAAGQDGDFVKASLIGVDYDIDYSSRLKNKYAAISIVVNARGACESETMANIMDEALKVIEQGHNLSCKVLFTECFSMMEEGRDNGGRASRIA
jgi:hypothetical protein